MRRSIRDPATISPPTGTGYVQALGEAFSLDLGTGQGTYSIPLPLPDGVAGWTPRLKLEYVYGAGQSPFGLGWSLPLRGIARRLDRGVPDPTSEAFLDGSLELIRIADGTYRATRETAFTRYERSGLGWVLTDRQGNRHELGLDPGSRVTDPNDPTRVQSWLIERSIDRCGNAIWYTYIRDGASLYLDEVRWATFRLQLTYETRPDVRQSGRGGFLSSLALRCKTIELYLDGPAAQRLRTWTLGYQPTPASQTSLLASVQLTAHATPSSPVDVVKPPLHLTYAAFDASAMRARFIEGAPGDAPPPSLLDPDVALLSLDELPLPGVVAFRNGRQTYWPNRGAGWGAPRPIGTTPFIATFGEDGIEAFDVDGDGAADLLVAAAGSPVSGFYPNRGAAGWGEFVAYPRGGQVGPRWGRGRLRLGDLDGDGRVDALESGTAGLVAWRNLGADGWAPPTIEPRGGAGDRPDVDLDDPAVQLADMTGDGLPDLVRVRSGSVEYWPNLGNGRFGPRRMMFNAPRLPGAARDPGGVLLVDVDGDGCADLVHVRSSGVLIAINRSGAAFADAHVDPIIPPPLPGSVRVTDFSGRCGAGLVWNSLRAGRPEYVSYDAVGAPAPYALVAVDNGAGLTAELEYRPAIEDAIRDRDAGVPWSGSAPFPLWVVGAVRERDAVTARATETRFQYHDAHYDPDARRFDGFARVDRLEVGDASRADVLTNFELLVEQARQPGHGPEHAQLDGMLARVTIYSRDGGPDQDRPLRIEESDYDVKVLDTAPDGTRHVFPFVVATRRRFPERTSDERMEESEYTYDDQGNVIREVYRGGGTIGGAPAPGDTLVTEVDYAKNLGQNLLGAPSRLVRRDAQGRLLVQVCRYYDGPPLVGLAAGQIDRGLVARETQLAMSSAEFATDYPGMDATQLGYVADVDADGTASWFAPVFRAEHDAFGNQIRELDALGHETRLEFDADGLRAISRTDALGTTRADYDATCGKPALLTTPDGAQARFKYDAYGRSTAVMLAGHPESDPTRAYTYDESSIPNAVIETRRIRAGERFETRSYFDGTGGVVQRRAERAPQEVIVSGWVELNPWGQARTAWEPTLELDLAFRRPSTAGLLSSSTSYDGVGRVTSSIDAGGGEHSAIYRAFEVVQRDANDNDASPANRARGQYDTPRRLRIDAWERRTAVEELDASGAVIAASRFQLGLRGELLSHGDINGSLATYRYDKLGRRVEIDHRDAGTRRLCYDAVGRTIRTRDAVGHDVTVELDAVGRPTRMLEAGVEVERYGYDDPAVNGFGRITEMVYRGGSQRFAYDPLGAIARQEHLFDGHATPYVLAYANDDRGLPADVTYPDGTVVTTLRYRDGLPRQVSGYVDLVRYDAYGLAVHLEYSNGVRTEVSYEPADTRVRRQQTFGPQGQIYADGQFTYDRMRLLLNATEATPAVQSTTDYERDPVYQLTRASGVDPGGAFDFRYRYQGDYALAGIGELGVDLAFADPARPTRPTEARTVGGATASLSYDDNGNLAGLPGRAFDYDYKNQLVRVTRGGGTVAEYAYDSCGNRISKRVTGPGGATETLLVGNLAEIRNGVVARYILLGHARVALADGSGTRYFHADALGSGSLFTDGSGAKLGRAAYTPFGSPRGSAGAPAARIFGAHEFDGDAGVYFMGRRCYAPEIGRFLTPDPLYLFQPERAGADVSQLALYSYVRNDPVDYIDPTGLSLWSMIGAAIGAAVGIIVAPYLAAALVGELSNAILGLAALGGVVTGSYALGRANAQNGFGEAMRGFMVGLNAGLNAVFGVMIWSAMLGWVGVGIGLAAGVINFLAAHDSLARRYGFQTVLGWSNWIMPMSWAVNAWGLIAFLVSMEGPKSVRFDRNTGSLITRRTPFTGGGTNGINFGNFIFLAGPMTFGGDVDPNQHRPDPRSVAGHEAGHTLNLAAFGSIWALVGLLDEGNAHTDPGRFQENLDTVYAGIYNRAYAERLADSHRPLIDRFGSDVERNPDMIPMWRL
jgi:RHS repeat-associated protein